jgi:hypothetical protein
MRELRSSFMGFLGANRRIGIGPLRMDWRLKICYVSIRKKICHRWYDKSILKYD